MPIYDNTLQVPTGEQAMEAEIDRKLTASQADILADRVLSQEEADKRMRAKFRHS